MTVASDFSGKLANPDNDNRAGLPMRSNIHVS